MTWLAAALAALAVLLAGPVPGRLAGSAAALRRPGPAVLAWQCVGAASGLAGIGALLAYGHSGGPLAGAGRVGAAGLAAYLVAVTGVVLVRTVRRRRAHRELLDLVAAPLPAVPGGRVLDSPAATAYCLPGRRGRVVLTSSAVDRLSPAALRAVVAHERAHLAQRHDLVRLPFAAWQAAWPFLPGARMARASVDLLVEALADDAARRREGASALASALCSVALTGERVSGDSLGTRVRLARLGRGGAPVG
ncbi:hypothetical protein GCM10010123_25100 [Pilimelia anulata]|uniref:Peptidase M48 domain-containing protein n=1 Tax=Pilimelia anulata TaxID=53371 RepID=A0A8J3FAY5_9ACTN|nr:M56 family metallopeptidase [Pilimelia anulata]GGJ94255.1 hypothetical protein GCM10010123_25100 [Pilimelia anulata]